MEKTLQEIVVELIKKRKIYYNPNTIPSSCFDILNSVEYQNQRITKFVWVPNVTYLLVYRVDKSYKKFTRNI
jgi:subtilase family serine protease